ncbi:MAG: hypothetical protein D6705_10480 [Deltaproteobacteria bacterium]|nr:MAG: hypothetical protein D6705_10480 [Deltaproteobacteria bacterium]
MRSITGWTAALVLSTGCAHGAQRAAWPTTPTGEVLSVTVVAAGEVAAFGRWPVGAAVRLVAGGDRGAWVVEATPARATGRPGHVVAMAVRSDADGGLVAAPVVWIEPGKASSVDVRAGGVPLRVEVGIERAAPWQAPPGGPCPVIVGRSAEPSETPSR